ncbi:LysR substrate-binding domain-containing protein, partial [Vibrio sp. 10N.261.49.A5]
LLNSFAALPNQNLSLEVFDQPDSDERIYEDLLTQEFDAMIDIVVPEHPSIVSETLYEGEFVIVCREDHPRIQGEIS